MTTTRQRQPAARRRNRLLLWVLLVCDAGLLVTSGLIHLHLWNEAYKNVATLDWLFLVQVVTCFVLALALLVTRLAAVVVASLLLMAGTAVGFAFAATVGIFGFTIPASTGVTSLAVTVLVVEMIAVVLLATTALVMWLTADRPGWRQALLTSPHGRW